MNRNVLHLRHSTSIQTRERERERERRKGFLLQQPFTTPYSFLSLSILHTFIFIVQMVYVYRYTNAFPLPSCG